MEAVAYYNFRKDLRAYMRQVNEDAEPLIVTAKEVKDTVVVMSKRDFDSMQETLRIQSNPYLYNKIKRGMEQARQGKTHIRDLIEVDDYVYWHNQADKATIKKINRLIKDIDRHPFEGIGKPEPLKHNLSGAWSRRISEEHRLVYSVEDGGLTIYSAKDHD